MQIELLVGMIASGKSTYARQRAKEGALVVSHDDLTEMLHAEYRYEPGLRACYRVMMIQLAHNALVAGRDVVIDRTHLTRESRKLWVDVARNSDATIIAVAFPTSTAEVHADRRFRSDHRGRSFEEWLGVAERHAAESEPLGDSEGFARIVRMSPILTVNG